MKCLLNEHSQAVVYKLWRMDFRGALFSPHLWGRSEKAVFYRPGRESSLVNQIDQPLDLAPPAPRTVRNKLLLFKLFRPWCFVTTAQAVWQISATSTALTSDFCLLCSGGPLYPAYQLGGVLITCEAPLSPLSNLWILAIVLLLPESPRTLKLLPLMWQNNLGGYFLN